MEDKLQKVVFKKKKLSDIFEEIYNRSNNHEQLTVDAISQLTMLIENGGTVADAQMIVPLIAQYMNIAIKTNDQLIKMTEVIQKAMERAKKSKDDEDADSELDMSPEEKAQLLEIGQQLKVNQKVQNPKA